MAEITCPNGHTGPFRVESTESTLVYYGHRMTSQGLNLANPDRNQVTEHLSCPDCGAKFEVNHIGARLAFVYEPREAPDGPPDQVQR